MCDNDDDDVVTVVTTWYVNDNDDDDAHEEEDVKQYKLNINGDKTVYELKEMLRQYWNILKTSAIVLKIDNEELMDSSELIIYSKNRHFFQQQQQREAGDENQNLQQQPPPKDALMIDMCIVANNDNKVTTTVVPTTTTTNNNESLLEVRVPNDDGQDHMVRVVVQNETHGKHFIGGFRNKVTGAEYHHADVQTLPLARDDRGVDKFHRETQTAEVSTCSQQTTREKSTQMAGVGVFQDGLNNIIRNANDTYVSANELDEERHETTIEIQCFVRKCIALRRIHRLRNERELARQKHEEEEKERVRQEEEEREREIQRRMNPRTKSDFTLLVSEIEAWRLYETKRIKNNVELSDEEKHDELEDILHKEIKLLQTIDRLKIEANKAQHSARIRQELRTLGKPKEFSTVDDIRVQIQTPFTNRVTELSDSYDRLCMDEMGKTERLDLLFNVKWIVKEHDNDVSRELLQLIDRETNLLNRGRSSKSVEGLRQRISTLFLTYVKLSIPLFDKETTRTNTSFSYKMQ